MTTHVFIVNEQTFPIHLQYQFAGTGARESEQHIELLADIKRVRPKDKVIFYLEGVGFYGVFRVAQGTPLVFNDSTYLGKELGKKLIYRVLIEPDEVYPGYVTEWEALDKLPLYAQEIIWSLIYRKFKAWRGCTPITIEESERLINMLRAKNCNQTLTMSIDDALAWDSNSKEIKVLSGCRRNLQYTGTRTQCMNILSGIIWCSKFKRAYEDYLQAYFTENIGIDSKLEPICGKGEEIIWIGNEVFCGVGMQKIDIFTITSDERENREHRVIELKDEAVTPGVVEQLRRYVNWTHSYIKGAINSNIQPIVIAPPPISGRGQIKVAEACKAFHDFNNEHIAEEIEYFEFKFDNNVLTFNKISY